MATILTGRAGFAQNLYHGRDCPQWDDIVGGTETRRAATVMDSSTIGAGVGTIEKLYLEPAGWTNPVCLYEIPNQIVSF